MATRKIRGSWWVDMRWNNRRYRKRSPVDTRSGAAEYELILRGKLLRGEPLEAPPASDEPAACTNVPFDEFAERWFETYVLTNNKPSEQRTKRIILRAHLLPWFGQLPLRNITAQHIEGFKAHQLSLRLARKTVNNQLAVIARCLRCAMHWGYLEHVPLIQLLRTCAPPFKVLTSEETSRLLAEMSEPMWNLMIHLGLRTGLRRGELMALDWADIDFARNRLTVNHAASAGQIAPPKTYQVRSIPLAADIRARLETIARPSGYIFPNPHGGLCSEGGIEEAIRRMAKKADIRRIGWHTLRHTFATELAANGVPLHVVKELLGHSTIAMTMRYAHVVPSMLDGAIRTLERSEKIAALPDFGQPVGTTSNSGRFREHDIIAAAA